MFGNAFNSIVDKLQAFLPNKKMLLAVLCKTLEDVAKHKVEEYDMIFDNVNKKIDFNIYASKEISLPPGYNENRFRKFKIDDPDFNKLLNEKIPVLIKENLTGSSTLDIAILQYRENGNKITLITGITNEEGEKIKQTTDL